MAGQRWFMLNHDGPWRVTAGNVLYRRRERSRETERERERERERESVHRRACERRGETSKRASTRLLVCRGACVRRAKPGWSLVVGDSKQFQECVACVSSALIWFRNRFLRSRLSSGLVGLAMAPALRDLRASPLNVSLLWNAAPMPLAKIYRAYVTFRPRN